MPDDYLPGTVIMNVADLQRLATLAANEAAAKVASEARLTKDDVEELVSEGINRFCDKCGLPTDKPGFEAFRLDLSSLRASREMRAAILKHGWLAVVTILVSGVFSAFAVGILTMFKK